MPAPISRIAVVTGAASPLSIGFAAARELIAGGWKVTLVGRRGSGATPVDAAVETLAGDGLAAEGLEADLTVSAEVEQLVGQILERGGRIDAWVNSAGAGQSPRDVEGLDEAEWERQLAANLSSVFLTARALAPVVKRQRSGTLVNVASRLGKTGEAGQAAYCAAKFGVVGLIQAVAREWAPFGARAVSVCPGVTDTGMPDAEMKAAGAAATPMGRVATPADVAGVIAFLCGPGAAFVTGDAINVSGGRWVH
jgi:NAD(P)-dependent dehydrogenase (short-subunit alcohol dehydrogenase family)